MSSIIKVDTIQLADGSTATAGALGLSGSTVQVVGGDINTLVTSSTTSMTDTGIEVSITPKFATSKIYIVATFPLVMWGSARLAGGYQLLRDSTIVAGGTNETIHFRSFESAGPDYEVMTQGAITKLDTPNTTSQITYKVQMQLKNGTNIQTLGQSNLRPCSIIAMEIAQ